MKITIGGTLGLTISHIPYSPVKVETTFIIEKEVDDLESIDKLKEKVDNFLESDLEKKMNKTIRKQLELKKKINNL